ncbi:MAG: SpoIIE family protein phosphatase [Phycicoccus sp.]
MPWADLERVGDDPGVFLAAADQIGSGVALIARDFSFLFVNTALARMNGRPVEAHAGRTVPQVLVPTAWAFLRPLYERVFAGESVRTSYTDEFDGALRAVDVQLTPVTDGSEVVALLVVATDTSLEESERRQDRALLDLAVALTGARSFGQVADAVVDHASTRMGAVDAGVYRLQDERTLTRVARKVAVGSDDGDLHVAVDEAVPIAAALTSHAPVWLESAEDWARFPRFVDLVRVMGWPVGGAIPVPVDGRARGVFFVLFSGGREIPDHVREAAATVSKLCGAAMERVVLSDDARRTDGSPARSMNRLAAFDSTMLFATARGGPEHVGTVNARMLELLGLDRLPDGGLSWATLSAPHYAAADARALARARAGDSPDWYEKHVSASDGRAVPVLASLVAEGDSEEVTGVFVDLGPVKAKEQENRRLIEDAQRLAQAMQQALLPTIPTATGPAQVRSAYRPGDDRLLLGGDFYDALTLADGSLAVLVGDVCGHGPDAAAAGAACRIAWRSAVLTGASLAEAVHLIEKVLCSERQDESLFATVITAAVDLEHGAVTIASAGHPPPVLVDRDAGHRILDVPVGTLLGVLDTREQELVTVDLEPGQALLLYTDGLIEGRAYADRTTRLGERGLVDLLTDLAPHELHDPQRILDAVMVRNGHQLPDDVALLLISAPELSTTATSGRGASRRR